jgi:hypothetical protein
MSSNACKVRYPSKSSTNVSFHFDQDIVCRMSFCLVLCKALRVDVFRTRPHLGLIGLICEIPTFPLNPKLGPPGHIL